jgi:hypothetical protein
MVLNRGRFVIEAGVQLQELTDAIIDTGKPGAILVKLAITPSGYKEGRINQFEIRPDVSIQKPKHDQGKSIFFVTENNKLVRDDPDQMGMDFEEEGQQHGRS